MTETQIIEELNAVFSNVLDKPTIQLTPTTQAQDIQGWDSLTHLELMVTIEKHFKIRFTTFEIQSFKNVGELVNTIITKIK